MASVAAVLSLLVTANTSQATAGLLGVQKHLGKTGSAADAMAAKQKKGADVINKSAQIGVLAVGGLAAASINAAADYEKSLNVFQAVSGATSREMSKVGKVAKDLGADIKLPGTSAADAAEAMTELAKGGLSVKESMAAARGVLQLSAAAEVDNAEAATIAARALNAFGMRGKDTTKIVDLLAGASNASTAEITDVAQALQQASASAHQLGIPIEDLTTAIGVMANAGIAGSDAGTSLKTMMARLTPATNKAADAFVKYGLATQKGDEFQNKFFDSQGRFIGMEKAIKLTEKALGGLNTEQKQQALNTLFGSDAQRAANIVLLGGAKNFDKMKDAVTKSGNAQALADAKTKGFKGSLEAFKSTLETLAITFGEVLLPAATSVMRSLASLFGGLGEHKTLVLAITAAIGGLSAAIVTVNLVTKAWAAATAAWAAVTTGATAVMGAFNTVLFANPIGLVVVALAALGAALVVAYKKSETFRDIVDTAFGVVKAAAGALWDVAKVVFPAIWDAIKTAWEAIKTVTDVIWQPLKAYLEFVWGAWKKVAETVFPIIKGVIELAWGAVSEITKLVWGALKVWLETQWDLIKTVAGVAWDAIQAVIVTPVRAVAGVIHDVFNAVVGFLGEVWERIKKAVEKVAEPFKAAFDGMKKAVDPVKDAVEAVIKAIKDLIDLIPKIPKISNPIQTAGEKFGGGLPVGPGNIGLLNSAQAIADYSLSWGLSGARLPGQAYRPGDDGWHGQNRARDVSGPAATMLAFAKMLASTVGPRLLELIHTPLGFGIKNGQVVPNSFWGAAILRDHYDHVHVAMEKGGYVRQGGWAVVGEKGPELAHLPSGTSVFSNTDSRALGGGQVVLHQHFNSMLPPTSQQAYELGREAVRGIGEQARSSSRLVIP